jgi:transcriptional regulator with XRE-family HTH domain
MEFESLRMSIDLIIVVVLLSVAHQFRTVRQKRVSKEPPYRTDLINAAMGARRLTNRAVAEKAGVGVMTVSKIRNGDPRVGYMTLKKVVEAVGLTIAEVSRPGAA